MLLYAVLHLCGYDLSLTELRRFRQWGSLTVTSEAVTTAVREFVCWRAAKSP
jgi:transketolase